VASDHAEHPTNGAMASSISNMVVRLMTQYTGRGPTRARTHISGDLVSVVLQDTLTKAERTLVARGEGTLVLHTRKAFQNTMRDDLVTGVEALTGRKVWAFLSDNHIDPDVAIESFLLEPNGSDRSADAGASDDG
jgi:uncharacterized protein YbcI